MKKIMFNDRFALTQAVLDGAKTQTRRLIRGTLFWERSPEGMWTDDEIKSWRKEVDQRIIEYSQTDKWKEMLKFAMEHSPYKVGEIVAVAISYRTIYERLKGKWEYAEEYREKHERLAGWKNKMFVNTEMPFAKIRITNVHVERLQDISNEDCLKEGIFKVWDTNVYGIVGKHLTSWINPKDVYAYLIDKISGKGTWESNPFVWVYDFELVK